MSCDSDSSREVPEQDKNRPYHAIGRFRHSLPTTQATRYRWQFNASKFSCDRASVARAGLLKYQDTVGQTSCQLHGGGGREPDASTRHVHPAPASCPEVTPTWGLADLEYGAIGPGGFARRRRQVRRGPARAGVAYIPLVSPSLASRSRSPACTSSMAPASKGGELTAVLLGNYLSLSNQLPA
jgi:hypothetical protein